LKKGKLWERGEYHLPQEKEFLPPTKTIKGVNRTVAKHENSSFINREELYLEGLKESCKKFGGRRGDSHAKRGKGKKRQQGNKAPCLGGEHYCQVLTGGA